MYSIDYTQQISDNPEAGTHVLTLEITAANGEDGWADTHLFLFQRELRVPPSAGYDSWFTAVCCPNDLEEVTTLAEPAPTEATPTTFRLAKLTAYFRSRIEAEQCLETIKADLAKLMRDLDLLHSHMGDPVLGTITSA